MLSTRIRKFHNLMRQANDQSTDWLISAVRNPGALQSKLSILACLRVIMARTTDAHLAYRDRMSECKREVFSKQDASYNELSESRMPAYCAKV